MGSRPRTPTTLAVLGALPALVIGLAACGQTTAGQPTTASSVLPLSAASSAPPTTKAYVPEVSPEEECPGSQFSISQFMGAWREVDGSTVTTLAQHGSLSATGDGGNQYGTWQFKQAGDTPAAADIPVPSTCVLWFSWIDPTMDLFYVPLQVSADHLELSYVGRGNTIEWERTER